MPAALVDERLMEALYEAALHAGDWAPALQRSSELLACAETSLAAFDCGTVTTFETTGRLLSDEARGRYQDHYHALDPKLATMARGGAGYLFNDADHFDDAFVARDPFYQEFSRWVGTRHTLDTSFSTERPVYFAAMRTQPEGPFQPSTARTFLQIARHFSRVHALKTRLDAARATTAYAEAALDSFADGLIVIDDQGRPILVNRQARGLLATGGELEWRRGRPAARLPALDRELQAMIDKARRGADLAAASVRIPRAHGAPLIVRIVRLPPSSALAGAGGALMVIGDPQARGRIRHGDLMQLFGLTPAEAHLALALAAGRTLQAAARERGVRASTARSQLLAILEKTGLHRQADLTSLIARLPGASLRETGP